MSRHATRTSFQKGHKRYTVWTDERRKKLGGKVSALRKVKKWGLSGDNNPAKRHEIRRRISNSVKKLWKNKEYRERIVKGNLGKIVSKQTREKISEANKGLKRSEKSKKRYREARSRQIIPKKDTSIEVKIQKFLKFLGISFFTHQYISKIKHNFQCDIFVPSMKMVIECDGDYWHKYPVGNDIDHVRTKELIEQGFKVLRLWEHEIREMDIQDFEKKLRVL